MKVFISWSGGRSRAVADLMSVWIKCVLQASEPWISTKHIDRGALWFSEINDKLRDVSVGIVCLTKENKDKPWILFETGALAKGLSSNRVCTFLIDLEPGDLTDPLAQFNHTKPEKSQMWELVRTLNSCMEDRRLDDAVLVRAFEVYWPGFEADFATAVNENPVAEVKRRPQNDVLMEILEATRMLSRRIGTLEHKQKQSPIHQSGQIKWGKRAELINIASDIYKRIGEGQARVMLETSGLYPYEASEILEAIKSGSQTVVPGLEEGFEHEP